MPNPLVSLLGSPLSPVDRRLLSEYGSVFVTTATPPPVIVFSGEDDVQRFQGSLDTSRGLLGSHEVELQTSAFDALMASASEAASLGASLTARAADAGRRSYDETVGLWRRNVDRGLDHWQALGMLTPETVGRIRSLTPGEQVSVVLQLEEERQIYFGTYLDRSILQSVAAPGSSQHLSMLAFDVAEYQDRRVEEILAAFGWFRTVVNDLPHFTFLGRRKAELAGEGLVQVSRAYGSNEYRFWVPLISNF